jgi:hypothetical protein
MRSGVVTACWLLGAGELFTIWQGRDVQKMLRQSADETEAVHHAF